MNLMIDCRWQRTKCKSGPLKSPMRAYWLLLCWIMGLLSSLLVTPSYGGHAMSRFGTPKYAAGFTHFDYVNPQAPQRGHLRLSSQGQTNFDKLNPFTVKGNVAPGVSDLLFETLAVSSLDERSTVYGLLAKDMQLAADQRSIIFILNPLATFNNGDRVLAQDVKHSFEVLMSPGAYPGFAIQFSDVAGVDVINQETVRFRFKRVNGELPYIVASGLPIFSHKWGGGKPFDQWVWEHPISSGPYKVDQYQAGQYIRFRKNPQYWAKNHAAVKGMYNFQNITYKLYKDDLVRLTAFKAGEFDAITEYRAKSWVRNYGGEAFERGHLIKRTFSHRNSIGLQGFVLNMRRPLFADKRVRQALGLAFDFEWMNRMLFFGQYERLTSFFTNSEYAASGLPSSEELAIIQPLLPQLDRAVLTKMPPPPKNDTPQALRQNLRLAQQLLSQAGWNYRNGALRNAKGEPFVIRYVDDGGGMGRLITAYSRNLAKLGIEIDVQVTDPAMYERRRKNFDFDMISVAYRGESIPGNELRSRFGSQSSRMPGSDNLMGIASPAVDWVIDKILAAKLQTEIAVLTKVLDRILWHGYYLVPHHFSKYHRVAYQKSLQFPKVLPLYYSAEEWILSMWWMGDAP